MKRQHYGMLVAQMDEFLEHVDSQSDHELHAETLALHMAEAAKAVYDASQKAQVHYRREYKSKAVERV